MKLRNIIISVFISTVICNSIYAEKSVMITPPLFIDSKAETIASIENNEIRLSYVRCGENNKALACSMQAKVDGNWQHFISPLEDNKIFVITGPEKLKRPNYKSFYPAWISADSVSTNPYLSGSICEAVPVNARKINRNSIEVEYITAGDHKILGVWTIEKDSKHVDFNVDFTPSKDGCYSIGILGLHSALPTSVSNILLPPMYQYRRMPEKTEMLLSAMMPTPVSMVETEIGGKRMTAFVSGDNTTFPLDWGGVDHSPMGFSLRNHEDMIEAVAFSPVLGMPDSKMTKGKTIKRKFVIGLTLSPWNETLEHISQNIYKVRDYRKQSDKSLTETIFNIIDLMNDDHFGGWDKDMKGHYDIEGKPTKAPTVVHSAPLAIIAAAINSGNEKMYIERALPTIEYTLSRKGYRWSTKTTDDGYNKDPETLRLSPFGSQFTTTYFEGLNRLLGNKNSWIREIALPDGDLRSPRGYSTPILSWVQALYAYRLTGDTKWLRRAKSTAARDADLHIYNNSSKPMRYQAFYNSTIYAPWWDFIDLYEITKDRQFLDAARYGAAHTLAGIRTWPEVKDSTQIIHPDGKYDGNATMWWKGTEQFRLGFPRTGNDSPQHDVEQWKVSPVGLGFEQPSTYFLRTKGKLVRPVFMSSWAPDFNRLYQYTGLDIFDTYARNAVIGRFTNYPGYYATGYTDLTMNEEFPYKGPDVSSIYYHHIPPHLSFTTDFLISEMIQRSNGKVSFPFGKQEGFVWFSNRIFGGEAGTVFDDKNVSLWMKKGLISCSAPQVNYITAISDKQFWILLTNENPDEARSTIRVNDDLRNCLSLPDANLVSANGKRKRIDSNDNTFNIEIQPKGFLAISIPINGNAADSNKDIRHFLDKGKIPTLKDGFKITESNTDAGKIYTFRIRSPFGWDSVYGFCETPPNDKISVCIENSGNTVSVAKYPYEWSYIKISPSEKVKLKITIHDKNGETQSHEIEI